MYVHMLYVYRCICLCVHVLMSIGFRVYGSMRLCVHAFVWTCVGVFMCMGALCLCVVVLVSRCVGIYECVCLYVYGCMCLCGYVLV